MVSEFTLRSLPRGLRSSRALVLVAVGATWGASACLSDDTATRSERIGATCGVAAPCDQDVVPVEDRCGGSSDAGCEEADGGTTGETRVASGTVASTSTGTGGCGEGAGGCGSASASASGAGGCEETTAASTGAGTADTTNGATGGGEVPETPCADALVTRTQGFWKNHTCVLEGGATGAPLVPVTLGASLTLATAADVEAYLDLAVSSDKPMILGQQLLAAKLNVAAFGIGDIDFADVDGDAVPETVSQLVAAADLLFDAGTAAEMEAIAAVLDALNNAEAETEGWFDPTCSDAPELCDGEDDDLDGLTDEACRCP